MRKLRIYSIAVLLFAAAVGTSCSDLLDEKPRSILTPDYLFSEQGIDKALTAAYSGMRFLYGTEGGMTATLAGTDEASFGGDGSAAKQIHEYGSGVVGNGTGPFWGNAFTYINTCNGIIQFAEEIGRDDLIPEAKFLRAHYYYLLVSYYGGVPLDLGSGELAYNDVPVRTSVRNTALEVLQAIVEDLKDAENDLPNVPAEQGRVGKAAAIHFLAKAYLGIASYYQTDYAAELGGARPGEADQYYRLALTTAKRLIDNRGTYGADLLPDFADVNRTGNEHNAEVLYLVEHTTDYTFDESGPANSGQAPNDGMKENRANFVYTPYYEAHAIMANGNALLERTREYGRGWRRLVPTKWMLDVAFGDKINDTRYYKTWQSIWKCNKPSAVTDGLTKDNGQPVALGDIVTYLPGYASYSDAPAVIQNMIDQVVADGARVWYTGEYTRNMFPTNLKHLDTAHPAGVDNNDPSHRPFIVAKFSETLLIAAEAALMSGAEDPSTFVNELRERAAFNNEWEDENTARAALRVSRSDIDLDFILDERTRELCCEQLRFYDLARTDQLVARIKAGYGIYYDVPEKEIPQDPGMNNIQRFHNLRPIPQGQIDAMQGENKSTYQNPGYTS